MTVVNKKTHKPTSNDVYIGRPSIWGNPFVIGKDGSRNQVINKYKILMDTRLGKEYWRSPEHAVDVRGRTAEDWLKLLLALDGKNLVCYCAPQACHGDVLEALIEEMTT